MAWTDWRAVIGTGSAFPPILLDGKRFAAAKVLADVSPVINCGR